MFPHKKINGFHWDYSTSFSTCATVRFPRNTTYGIHHMKSFVLETLLGISDDNLAGNLTILVRFSIKFRADLSHKVPSAFKFFKAKGGTESS